MSALPSSRKTHSEKHKQIFRQLLKELPNKSCVDCKTAQHPRWASWNLGCFICIRCSGIHRSMGTHISRVKSVDLDVWTDEQVESMIKWGNEKCNLFWEDKLPDGYVPDSSKIENFIRTKYDMKKWAASSKVPDPMSISSGSSAPQQSTTVKPERGPQSSAKSTSNSLPGPPRPHKHVSASTPSLLDDDFGAFASSTSNLSSPSPVAQNSRSTPAMTTGISPSAPPRAHTIQAASPVTPSAPAPRASDVRTDLKKSILSLYSSPSSSSSSVHRQQPQAFRSPAASSSPIPQPQGSATPVSSVSGLSNSLMGLSFGTESLAAKPSQASSTTAFASSPQPSMGAHTPTATSVRSPVPSANISASSTTSQWVNEWNDSSSSVNQWASAPSYNGTNSGSSALGAGFSGTFGNSPVGTHASTGSKPAAATDLDDDLFKNVWG